MLPAPPRVRALKAPVDKHFHSPSDPYRSPELSGMLKHAVVHLIPRLFRESSTRTSDWHGTYKISNPTVRNLMLSGLTCKPTIINHGRPQRSLKPVRPQHRTLRARTSSSRQRDSSFPTTHPSPPNNTRFRLQTNLSVPHNHPWWTWPHAYGRYLEYTCHNNASPVIRSVQNS